MTAPPVQLKRCDVPDESWRDPYFGTLMSTGRNAVEAVERELPPGVQVAIDIETPSVTDCFTIKCVTASWQRGSDRYAVLLDPTRRECDAAAVRIIAERAGLLILHNAPFDVPGLVFSGLLRLEQIGKVMDTLVIARAAYTDTMERKGLADLAKRLLNTPELRNALKLAIQASGFGSTDRWYREGDIDMPTYRLGAMNDTVVTLLLAAPLFEAALRQLLNHPFGKFGLNDRAAAAELLMRHQRVNRTLLRRGARGLEVDQDYLDRYMETVSVERAAAEKELTDRGLRPGVGADIIKMLDEAGQLPRNWPRTAPSKTRPHGTLKADKAAMERLPDHPAAQAHRVYAHTTKVAGYMEKVSARSRITGRVHPQFAVLGASATGRMSTSEPELQQFPEEARPIIRTDRDSRGMQSTDWSSIEPALLAWLGNDWDFISPFEQGEDLYAAIMVLCGVPRKVAKVILLALMYGRGDRSMAESLGVSVEVAREYRQRLLKAMPKAAGFARKVQQIASVYGVALTISGRILKVPAFNGQVADYKAVNYTIQGSNADMLYDSILELEDAGLADGILIPMHDELVTTEEIAQEVEQAMRRPPPGLLLRTGGRVPIIRTDSVPLGFSWSVLTVDEQIEVRQLVRGGAGVTAVAERFKTSPTMIRLLTEEAA